MEFDSAELSRALKLTSDSESKNPFRKVNREGSFFTAKGDVSMKTWLDLHMHSSFSSDGEFAPRILVEKCAEANLKTIALADHNCIRGNIEAKSTADELGLEFFPAVELDCTFDEGYYELNFHLLGYGINPHDENLLRNEESVHQQEINVSSELLRRIHELGFQFNDDEVWSKANNGVIVAEMIGETILRDSRNDSDDRLKDFRPGGMKSNNPPVNFYWDFCSLGKPAYVPMNYISFADAVRFVKNAGGAAVLAHPGVNMGQNREVTEKLIKLGIDGIEVYSNYHDAETRKFYLEIVNDFNLIATSGSDFHGSNKPSIHLGEIGNPKPEKVVERLKSIISERGGVL